ncbi:MAG: peptidase M23, partial [Flavobacterium sp.]|nr:peptidase M23 [Flavobacterium sp.]
MSTLLSIISQIQNVSVIDATISKKDYVCLDLSKNNTDLLKFDCGDAIAFEEYIESYLTKNNAKVAFGGYNEIRR